MEASTKGSIEVLGDVLSSFDIPETGIGAQDSYGLCSADTRNTRRLSACRQHRKGEEAPVVLSSGDADFSLPSGGVSCRSPHVALHAMLLLYATCQQGSPHRVKETFSTQQGWLNRQGSTLQVLASDLDDQRYRYREQPQSHSK